MNSQCSWTSANILSAKLASTGLLAVPGDFITLLPKKVRRLCTSGCSKYLFTPSTKRAILYPTNPLKVSASVVVSPYFGSCEDILLDPTASSGDAGRNWLAVRWSVASTDTTPFLNENISLYLNNRYSSTNGLVSVPNRYLKSNIVYTFTLRLTNFLLSMDIATTIPVTGSLKGSFPIVRINGLQDSFYRVNETINLHAIANFPSCNVVINGIFDFSWKVWSDGEILTQIISISNDPSRFVLGPFSLLVNKDYTVQLITTLLSQGSVVSRISNSVLLSIRNSGPVAVIIGGTYRTKFFNSSLLLDSSASYASNGNSSSLSYHWSCQMLSPSFGKSCRLNDANLNQPVVVLPPFTLTSGVYLLTIFVSDNSGFVSNQTCSVTVLNFDMPTLSITNTATVLNIQDKITLNGLLVSNAAVTATWYVSDSLFDLSAAALTSTLKTFSKGNSTFALSIRSYSLIAGMTYTFFLSAQFLEVKNGQTASCGIMIYVNSPPFGGLFSIEPTAGIAAETRFLMSTYHWSDAESNYPIQFAFSFYSTYADGQILLKGFDSTAYITAFISQGVQVFHYAVTCVAFALDVMGGVSNITRSIVVTPVADLQIMWPSIQKKLSSTLAQFDLSTSLQLISATAAALNAVNCSVPKSCEALHRFPCESVAHTCGNCLSGYVGVDNSNKACVLASTNAIFALTSAESVSNHRYLATYTTNGGYCANNLTCLSQSCVSSHCTRDQKTCPSNCFGHGVCKFYDFYLRVSSHCYTEDYHCSAICECTKGWEGDDCSLSSHSGTFYSNVRLELCSNLLNITSIADVSAVEMRSRSNILVGILKNVQQISDAANSICASVLYKTMMPNLDLLYVGSTWVAVSSALSALFATYGFAHYQSGNVLLMSKALALVSHSYLQPGEQPFRIYTDNFRSLSVVNGRGALNNTVLMPQSNYADFINSKTESFSSGSKFNGAATKMGFSLLDTRFDPFTDTSNSTVVTVIYSGDLDQPLSYMVSLTNIQPISYRNIPKEQHSIQCAVPSENPPSIHVFCKNYGSSYTIKCPSNSRGQYNISCPYFLSYPVCKLWNGHLFQKSPLCEVVSFASMNTTCKCRVTEEFRSNEKFFGVKKNFTSLIIVEHIISSTYAFESYSMQSAYHTYADIVSIRGNIFLIATISIPMVIFLLWCSVFAYARASKMSKSKISPIDISKEKHIRKISDFFDSLIPQELIGLSVLQVVIRRFIAENEFCIVVLGIATTKNFSDVIFAMFFSLFCGKVVSYVFVTTLIGYALFFDNGQCNKIYYESECISAEDFLGFHHICEWKNLNKSCSFNEVGGVTVNDIFWILLCSIAFVIILNNVFERALSSLNNVFLFRPRGKDDWGFDELSQLTSMRKRLLLGAKFAKIQEVVEFKSVQDEAQFLHRLGHRNYASKANGINFDIVTPLISYEESMESYASHINQSRLLAITLSKTISLSKSDAAREEFLIKQFFINMSPLSTRAILNYVLFNGYNKFSREVIEKKDNMYMALLCYTYLFVHFAGFSSVIIYAGFRTNSTGVEKWGLLLLATAVLDNALIRIIHLCVKWWAIFLVVSNSRLLGNIRHLKTISKLVLIRSSGVMNSSHSIVQHFNPACRLALQYPGLAISRLLLSLSDYDFDTSFIRNRYGFMYFRMIQLFSATPKWIPNLFIDFFSIGILFGTWFVMLVLYYQSSMIIFSFSIAAVAILVIFILLALYMTRASSNRALHYHHKYEHSLKQRDRAIDYASRSSFNNDSFDTDLPSVERYKPFINAEKFDSIKNNSNTWHGSDSREYDTYTTAVGNFDVEYDYSRLTSANNSAREWNSTSEYAFQHSYDYMSQEYGGVHDRTISQETVAAMTTQSAVDSSVDIITSTYHSINAFSPPIPTSSGVNRPTARNTGLIDSIQSSPGGYRSKRRIRDVNTVQNGPGTRATYNMAIRDSLYDPSNYSSLLMVDSTGPLPTIDYFADVDNVDLQLRRLGPGKLIVD